MLYATQNLHPVHRLHYAWTGWPKEGSVFPIPILRLSGDSADPVLAQAWRTDGLSCLSETWTPQQVQLVFSVMPNVDPITFAARVKGRLQHALRRCGSQVAFSRKIAMRALGENVGETVEQYVREQLSHADLADPRYRQRLADAALEDPAVDLTQPTETESGRYWYNLHVVLVTESRYRVGAELNVGAWQATVKTHAEEQKCLVRSLAVMPDHVHMALRGNIALSPVEIGVGFQNALAKTAGCRLWQENFYVGTFGEYSLQVVTGGN
jgi:REP element-mobilizing transposase RayT